MKAKNQTQEGFAGIMDLSGALYHTGQGEKSCPGANLGDISGAFSVSGISWLFPWGRTF
jgi:hypothetical protein